MKRKILLISLLFVLFIMPVYAINVVDANDVLTVTGKYDSTRFLAGNKITNEGEVNGILFTAGNNIILNGSSTYGFYAGNNINFNERIKYDAFIAGNSITIGKEAVIERDLYVAGSDIVVQGNIGRDLRAGGSLIDIRDITIKGDAYIYADSILLNEKTNITGKLTYREDAKIDGLKEATIGDVKVLKVNKINRDITFKERIIGFITKLVSSTIVLLILLYLLPKVKEKLDNKELESKSIIKSILIGLLLLIIVPILAILSMITIVLIPLSLITMAIYIISIYLSTLIISYIVGNRICKKLFNNENVLVNILFGLLIIYLLKLIPYVGGFVSFITITYGIGLIFNYIRERQM